ncbi:putative AraC family transcriptional regulatory protein [Pedobacter sp. BAL39]|uniref:helix-turn-helix domain-containing protein n=1 Tax=Pedobacter sp. BAL39 TaxID=391596 RepID=UPI000155962C|nr:helix-turn-helix domain-containing protein [Pedobacter sp. BAL39]EDM36910.1 putative AraC family transcriptional regulatory protein [Pedobacter sp. BAL39]
MEHTSKYITPDIKLSCYEDKLFKSEVVFDQHMLIWFMSGETKILQAGASHTFKAGDIFLIPRNQPATIINYPKDGLPHKSVVMLLSAATLNDFYASVKVKAEVVPIPKIRSFKRHPLLESCLASLVPYFEMEELPPNLASLKINEAISILRSIDPEVDGVLANFEEPGKVDLSGFMEKNYMFNMTMTKFGYLTGRSITTFKRDFKKTYNTTPHKWLMQKRLELAHYLMSVQGRRPVEVIFETGFENLSHFSFLFKKHFGYAPTELPEGGVARPQSDFS